MTHDDRQLLIRTRDGHEPAARLLWERHAPRLIAYASSILSRGLSAEDVVQSVFCRVVALDRGTVARVEDVTAWLMTLARREALNAIRGARRERARVTGKPVERSPRDGAEPRERPVSNDRLRAALDALPRRQREVVTLKHVAGLTFDQIAAALGLNRNTAATRYRAAIDALRRALATEEPTERLRHGEEVHHG